MKLTAVYILLTLVASVIIYSFTTFATIDYVDDKHASVKEDLVEIKEIVKEQRTLLIDYIRGK